MHPGAILPSPFCLFFVRRNEWNIEKKNRPKIFFARKKRQLAFRCVRKYLSMLTFSVLFILRRRSNKGLSGPHEADVRATKPILPRFAWNTNIMGLLGVFILQLVHPDLDSGKVCGVSIFYILHTPSRNFGIAALKQQSEEKRRTQQCS